MTIGHSRPQPSSTEGIANYFVNSVKDFVDINFINLVIIGSLILLFLFFIPAIVKKKKKKQDQLYVLLREKFTHFIF